MEPETNVLSKGMNFCVTSANIPFKEIISKIEGDIKGLPKEEADILTVCLDTNVVPSMKQSASFFEAAFTDGCCRTQVFIFYTKFPPNKIYKTYTILNNFFVSDNTTNTPT